jgi:hypothetical protein
VLDCLHATQNQKEKKRELIIITIKYPFDANVCIVAKVYCDKIMRKKKYESHYVDVEASKSIFISQ